VRDVGIGARQPFQISLTSDTFYFLVDSTKQMTIEFVSSFCETHSAIPGTGIPYVISTTVGAQRVFHNFNAKFAYQDGPYNFYSVNTDMTRIYADANTYVSLGGTFACTVTLSGYTEPK
jgi:hypothetical protein